MPGSKDTLGRDPWKAESLFVMQMTAPHASGSLDGADLRPHCTWSGHSAAP